jgi:ABC-type sulfate transport system substrate-binding protein
MSYICILLTKTYVEGPEKKVRGKTRGVNADKVLSQLNAKIPVTLTKQNESPTCPYAEMLANEIGFIVRKYAPLNVEQWKDIESTDVTNIVQRISVSEFVIPEILH